MSDTVPDERRFSRLALGVVAISLVGAVANFLEPRVPIAFVANVVCLWLLYNRAVVYARDRVEGFDHVVAAEAMVAFGVFSLVLGLASVGARIAFGLVDIEALRRGGFADFIPFVEGLLTAGFAPFFAIVLRLRIAELDSGIDAVGDLSDLTRATLDLTRQMDAARTAIEAFGTGAATAGKSTVGLASTMKTEADRWALALQEGEASVKSFGASTKSGTSEVAQLAVETQRLRVAVTNASTLLEELARLIQSVERFVAPRAKA